jgi:hypothetical protein
MLTPFEAKRCPAQQGTPPSIEVSNISTPGVPGFTTYLFEVVPAEASSVVTVSGRFTADLSGAMRQVNPSGLDTVFEDNNGAIVAAGESPLADSQFEFLSSDAVLVIDVHESDTELRAALGGLAPLSTRFALAHVVVDDEVSGTWQIGVVQRDEMGTNRQYHQAGMFGLGMQPLTGDFNQNGTVDAADYVVWRDMLGQMGDRLAADGNGNQQIDVGDYYVWRASFGQSAGGALLATRALPEPATWFMLVGAAAAGVASMRCTCRWLQRRVSCGRSARPRADCACQG